jgi:predicted aspartyl protease
MERIPVADSGIGAVKTYGGVSITIRGEQYKFIVDTGATINLVKSSVATKLNLYTQTQVVNSVGLGGGGAVAGKSCIIQDCQLGAISMGIQCAILDNERAIPSSAAGLLGISFLQALGITQFDYEQNQFRFSPDESYFKPLDQYVEVPIRRLPIGLAVCDVLINGQSVTAMIDLGSTYSILNSKGVQAASQSRQLSLGDLKQSNVICAGIDGNPLPLRIFPTSTVSISGRNGPIDCPVESVFAADIPGFAGIGLDSIPAMILGVEMLATKSLIFNINGSKMYIKR